MSFRTLLIIARSRIMDRVAISTAVRHVARRKPVCVGADVGGTWVRIAVWTGTRRVPTVVIPADRNLQKLPSVLHVLWRRRRWSRRRVASLVVASRGLWNVRERHALARRLREIEGRLRAHSEPHA